MAMLRKRPEDEVTTSTNELWSFPGFWMTTAEGHKLFLFGTLF
jgi:hypothetical protein